MEIPRFEKENVNPRLAPTDIGDAFQGFVHELRNLRVTDWEIDFLRCVANGESNSSIAKNLGISESEVSAHLKHILRKLRVSNRTQAALWAVARGLAWPFTALNQLGKELEGETQSYPKNSPSFKKH